MIKLTLLIGIACAAVVLFSGARRPVPDDSTAISRTLDSLHAAASKADFNAYFSLFAPDAIFLGTDATERWTLEEFKTYTKARFDTGKGWTYTLAPGSRHVTIDRSGGVAWFDELLDNAKYGRCRGSGVLRKTGDDWRIAQYNLTFTIPNDVASDVVALIKTKSK